MFRWSYALFEAMDDARLFEQHRSDFHGGNWMLRKDGRRKTLVVTDPIAPRESSGMTCGSS